MPKIDTDQQREVLENVLNILEGDRDSLKAKLANVRVKIHRVNRKLTNLDQLVLDMETENE